MVFGVASFASRTITLEPGDLLVTGTPSGVGMAADPARFLNSGDRMRSRSTASASSTTRCEQAADLRRW